VPLARRFPVFAVPVLLLATAWLLLGAHARQLEARALCPDWPECYRQTAVAAPVAAALPAVAGVVRDIADGILAAGLAGLAGFGWQRRMRPIDRRWLVPLAALALVGSASMARLLETGPLGALWQWCASMTVLALLWWSVLRERHFWRPLAESPVTRALRPRVLIGLGLAFAAAVLGSWSMGHGIGVPCPDFPACRGEWWPGNLPAAFTVPGRPDLATAMTLAMSHRLGAAISLIYVSWLGLHVWRIGVRERLCRYGMLVLAALLAAVGIGIMGAVTRLPLTIAVAHSAAAAGLLLSLVTLYHVVRPVARPEKRNA
jgi:cytochrome c oxidase assembly protein subunit 15